jgi:hypothetical protein
MDNLAWIPYDGKKGKFFWQRGEYPRNSNGSYQNFSSSNPPCDFDGSRMWNTSTIIQWANSSVGEYFQVYNRAEFAFLDSKNKSIVDVFNPVKLEQNVKMF